MEPSQRRLNPIRRQQMEERCRELEEEIARHEAGIAHCECSLQNFISNEETVRLTRELTSQREELQLLLSEWEELAQALQE